MIIPEMRVPAPSSKAVIKLEYPRESRRLVRDSRNPRWYGMKRMGEPTGIPALLPVRAAWIQLFGNSTISPSDGG